MQYARQHLPPLDEGTPPVDSGGPKKPSRTWLIRTWLKRIAAALATLFALGVAAAIATFLYFDRGLPSVETLRHYRPPQVTKVTCADGSVCAEYYRERRTNIDSSTLPPQVKNAFLAAEDADFYKHEGLDYFGMARAALKSLLPGGHVTGASTITQQACRNLLLSRERKLSRKIREWILTPRMEKALSKEQILNLYLNEIYFGHLRYGLEEAALFYFGKHAKDLSLGEAATLAGTIQRPERINPVTNIVRAKGRQRYVLAQMIKHGFAPKAVIDAEMEKPIVLASLPPPQVGPYYAEEIRRTLLSRYGEEAVLVKGLRVDIAMIPKLQAMADESVRNGLELLDRRHGYRGALGTFELARFQSLRKPIQERIAETGKRHPQETLVADLSSLAQPKTAKEEESDDSESERAATLDESLVQQIGIEPLHSGSRLAGLVTKVDDAGKFAELDLVSRIARIPFASLGWARARGVGKWTPAPTKVSDVLHPGDIVRARIVEMTPAPKPLEAALDQIPEVQGALVAIDPSTRRVVAMTGGYNFWQSPYNRATQARRQPGSAFKPFLYAAAIASQKYTPVSIINDAPEAVRDPYTGKVWKPQNFEKGGYDGPVTLRQALTKSKNTVSVRLIEALTPQVAIDFARRAGIRSLLPDNLTLALGTGEVGVLELANAYATLQSLGKFAEPLLLLKVTDANGTVLEEHQSAFEETIPPPVAYLITSLMKSVVEEGTAVGIKELGRPAAAKTGTASEFRDAWLSGFTPDLVTTAWVGFDNHDSLGNGETGAKAALPLWLQFMKGAEEGLPRRDFEVPPGVVLAQIDPATGLLAGPSRPGRTETFLEGTAPTAEAPAPGVITPEQLLLEDKRRGL